MTFDWSYSGRDDHPHDLHWVFFYADIEREVLPVTTGYRLTVSFIPHRPLARLTLIHLILIQKKDPH